MGDAVSHSVLPGVVIAYVIGFPYAIGAFVAGMICAMVTGFLSRNSRLKEDTVMGIVFSSMFALGLVMLTKIESDVHLDHILFGDVLGLNWQDVLETGIITLVVAASIAIKGRDLIVFVFDHQHAKVIGLPVTALHYGLLALLSLTIVGALKAVGMILVIAMLIAPGAIAHLMTQRFELMMAVAVSVSLSCSIAGVYLSFFINSAPAPTIVMLLSIVFIATFSYTSYRSKQITASVN